MRIRFNIHYPSVWGQSLAVAGSAPELGLWDVSKARELSYHPGDEWRGEVDFAGCVTEFEYKYVVKDDAGAVTWEWGKDRRFIIDKPIESAAEDAELIDVRDSWRGSSDPDSLFLTSAFRDVIFGRAGAARSGDAQPPRPPAKARTIVRLRVEAPRLDSDDALFVTGSLPALGSWKAAKALPMSSDARALWTIDLELKRADIPFSYKYVIKDRRGTVVLEEKAYRNIGGGNYAGAGAPKRGRGPKAGSGGAAGTEGSAGLLIVTDHPIRYPEAWRGAGVAVPVFALRSKDSFGVGEFADLKLLADWAALSGLQLIQLLPVNDTTVTMMWWDSYPYANVSVFALHPLYLNLRAIGKLPPDLAGEMDALQETLNGYDHVKYDEVVAAKLRFARELFQRAKAGFLASADFRKFFDGNRPWLEPYAAFSALRDRYKTADFTKWERYAAVKAADIGNITAAGSQDYDSVAFYYFLQYHLHIQLKDASDHAKAKGVVLKGDIPIGIHKHSDSCWLEPGLFHRDQSAGAPPDPFSDVGQNWGFPTYDWQAMKADGYSWWRQRLGKMSEYFQMVRLDHVLGFFRIWEIPDTMTSGLMGRFNPAIPLSREELERDGIWDFDRLTDPYIPLWLVRIVFGSHAQQAIASYLDEAAPGHYRFKDAFNTQKKIESALAAPADAPADVRRRTEEIRAGLSFLVSNIILFRDAGRPGFHPRINMADTPSFDCLDAWIKEKLIRYYNDYFYSRQEGFWRGQGLEKLPALQAASPMLICGEDLGMIPDCVPAVMEELCILGLRIQRMPREESLEFGDPAEYPYLTVCTTSSHDMSTLRGWWGEDYARTQRYWKSALKRRGEAPSACGPEICRSIIAAHLESPSMWAVFPIQDILAMSDALKRPGDPREEQVNEPADPHHYWKFRLHIGLEKLIAEKKFSQDIRTMVADAGRLKTY